MNSSSIEQKTTNVIHSPTELCGGSPLSLPANSLFGTDGIRGRVDRVLSAPLALQLGKCAGRVMQTKARQSGPVIVGQDSRTSGDMLTMALSAGLTAAGVEVWHLGLCPTPAVAYLSHCSEAIGGAMISASHNPPEDNGLKFFGADGIKLSTSLQAQIEAELRRGCKQVKIEHHQSLHWGQLYYRPELLNQYLQSLHKPLLPQLSLTNMRIVLDLAWGAAVNLAPEIFRAMGAEVICLHDRADGNHINVNCGSTHLAPLQAAVQEYQAELGFAFDGDADRVIAVDAQGRVVDGDYILYFWGQTLRQRQQLPGAAIVTTVMANLGFERAWESLGGKLVRTPVGDRHVYAQMLRTGSMLGGEQSGHILCRHYGVSGDGLLTALHLAALVKQAETSLSELLDGSFQSYPQLLKNVPVEDRERCLNWKNCAPLQQAIAEAETAMGDRGRVLVRVSGTEPVIRVMVEAASADIVNYWTEKLVLAVQKHLVT